MTASTSLRLMASAQLEPDRRASLRPSPQDPQPGVLLAGPAAPTDEQPGERAGHEDGQRREEDRNPGGEQGGSLRVERERLGRLVVEAGADAAEQRTGGQE